MKKIMPIIVILLAIYIVYSVVRFYKLVQVSKGIIAQTIPFTKRETNPGENQPKQEQSILVLGDSSGVGVGARRPEESVAGLLSSYVNATYVENRAVSGALVRDLPVQIAKASRVRYDLILVQIGGNDIVRFHNAKVTATLLAQELKQLPDAKKIIVISAGDVGTAPLFPLLFHPLYHSLNLAYHAEFANVLGDSFEKGAGKNGRVTYVNLYTAPGNELFSIDPGTYFAADNFHPSSAGYAIWFGAVRATVSPPSALGQQNR